MTFHPRGTTVLPLIVTLFLMAFSGCGKDADTMGDTGTYSTKFPLTEDPISESKRWINGKTTGLDWADVATTSGHAIGDPAPANYTDPTALLTGSWGPDQTVSAVVYSVNQTENQYQEVEIRLRSALSAHKCTGYEINFRCLKTANAYTQIVRWNGPVGDFTYLATNGGAKYGVADGDIVKATIVGNVITACINGVQVAQATDKIYVTGNPGIGFNANVGSTNVDFGFKSVSVSDDAGASQGGH
jgi:hypothetical protein